MKERERKKKRETKRIELEERRRKRRRKNGGPDIGGENAREEVGREFTGRIIKFLAEESVFPLV